MNVIERTAGGIGRVLGSLGGGVVEGFKAQGGNPIAAAMYREMDGASGVQSAESLVANQQAYKISAIVYSCVSAIATQGASVPFVLYRRKGADRREWEKILGHPILDLLANPNPDATETGFDLTEALLSDLELAGNWYLYGQYRNDGLPERIWRLRPDQMKIVPSKKRRVHRYEMHAGTETVEFDREDVTQSRTFNPFSDLVGLSSISAARLPLTLDTQALLWDIGFFKDSATPEMVLETDTYLTEDQAKAIGKTWQKKFGGKSHKHKTALLHSGMKAKPIGIPHADMQFLETRKFSREEILGCFHVPPFMVGILEYANYANANAQRLSFWHETMIPKLVKMQGALTRALCWRYDKSLVLEFDLTKVYALTQNALEMAKVDAQLIQCGMYLINERRDERGLRPLSHGDKAWMQIQYVQVGELENQDSDTEGKTVPATPVKGKRLYTDPRHLKGRDIAWEAILLPTRQQFARKVVTILGKQEKEVIANIRGEKRSPEEILRWVHDRAKSQAEGRRVTKQMLKDAASAEVESWLFDYEYWQNGSIKAVHQTQMNAAYAGGRFAISEVGVGIAFDLADPRVQQAIKDKEFVFAQEWNSSTLDGLRDTLSDGVLAGESTPELIERVKEAFGHEKNNANVVAQTEVGGVSNAGAEAGYRQSGVVGEKEWHAGGPNPRPHHAKANGQVVGIDEDFTVMGEQMRYPGDPRGSAKNVCGCHCGILPVLREV